MSGKDSDSFRIFISHAWGKDKLCHRFAMLVAKVIRELGYSPWIDEERIEGEESIPGTVKEVIESPDCMTLLLLTHEYDRRPDCIREYQIAKGTEYATGRMITRVMLDDESKTSSKRTESRSRKFEEWPELYQRFIRLPGGATRIPRDFEILLTERVRELVTAIANRYRNYCTEYFYSAFTDNTYKDWVNKTRKMYENYPQDHQDPFPRVLEWLAEGVAKQAKHFPTELYLVAWHKSHPVGFLYATAYTGAGTNPSFCLIHVLWAQASLITLNGTTVRSSVKEIAIGLLQKLKKEVHSENERKQGGACRLFFAELPPLSQEYSIRKVWRAWSRHGETSTVFKLRVVPGLHYCQPDLDWEPSDSIDPEPQPASLLLLRAPNSSDNMKTVELDQYLRLLFLVAHAECYEDPYCIFKWWPHVIETYEQNQATYPPSRFTLIKPEFISRNKK